MTSLDVVVDQAGVACSRVQAFPQVLEKDPHEHGAYCEANQRQTFCCMRVASDLQGRRIRRHREPLRNRRYDLKLSCCALPRLSRTQ